MNQDADLTLLIYAGLALAISIAFFWAHLRQFSLPGNFDHGRQRMALVMFVLIVLLVSYWVGIAAVLFSLIIGAMMEPAGIGHRTVFFISAILALLSTTLAALLGLFVVAKLAKIEVNPQPPPLHRRKT